MSQHKLEIRKPQHYSYRCHQFSSFICAVESILVAGRSSNNIVPGGRGRCRPRPQTLLNAHSWFIGVQVCGL